MPPAERLPEAAIEAAIHWAVRLNYHCPDPQDQDDFNRWLEAAPSHGVAWQRINGMKGFKADLATLPPHVAHDALQAAQRLRAAPLSHRRGALKVLALAGVAVGSGWLAREHLPWQSMLADASTGVGQQRTLRLDDGSVVVLNTDSAINIDLSGASRVITLLRGEILVTTGADGAQTGDRRGTNRPFWVSTVHGRLQALGTRFTVRLDSASARISVQEGAVELHPARAGRPVVISAGQGGWLMPEGAWSVESRDVRADDWAEGVIAGKDMRLQDLLAELQRYRPGLIVCDPRVADLRTSGVFHVNDTDQALQFLVQTQPVSVVYRTRWWVTVGPEPGR
ncbi:FecR domain-containing protein [Acidovorax sp. Leaf160]|uniref:FecR domain-containing protein n=1 Tax=Acidovorax sp. Leaf160 TaxID=1736280 RepID=UPI000A9AAA3F|nr:FecR domain-containing protein [Acidovorax sp. Leaf160]